MNIQIFTLDFSQGVFRAFLWFISPMYFKDNQLNINLFPILLLLIFCILTF